jgi:Uma2 family endonuclease
MALSRSFPQAPWGEYAPQSTGFTVEQFAALPDDDGWVYELHQGRLVRMPGPGDVHGVLTARLARLLGTEIAARNLGDVRATSCYYLPLSTGEEILCPDLSYVAPERLTGATLRGSYLALAPDWVIEISSPNDYRPQLQQKMQIYLAAGVRLGWVVWPNSQTVDIWRPGDTILPSRIAIPGETLDGAEIIPGLTLTMQTLFDF